MSPANQMLSCIITKIGESLFGPHLFLGASEGT